MAWKDAPLAAVGAERGDKVRRRAIVRPQCGSVGPFVTLVCRRFEVVETRLDLFERGLSTVTAISKTTKDSAMPTAAVPLVRST